MSKHSIEIIEIGPIGQHPNADRLEITHVKGWQLVIGKGDFTPGSRAIHVPPDYTVPTTIPEFAFLATDHRNRERVRVARLRGIRSEGVLIPCPESLSHLPVGTDVMEELCIERYEPTLRSCTNGREIGAPPGVFAPKFDVENYQNWPDALEEGDAVIVTEKIHGASSRFVGVKEDGEFVQYVGSRRRWIKEHELNQFWQAFHQCPAIGKFCREKEGYTLYGEVFGPKVQKFDYGGSPNRVYFAAFGVRDRDGNWLDARDFHYLMSKFSIPTAPILYSGEWHRNVPKLAQGFSTWRGAEHIREGIVVLPMTERKHRGLGRLQLKIVSDDYLAKAA